MISEFIDSGVVTEAKNEEGLTEKLAVGILVHAVKKTQVSGSE
jgi:hypothetical protein